MTTSAQHMLISDDYDVTCTVGLDSSAHFRSRVRIERKRDGRIIYPFDGCPAPSAFLTDAEARADAQRLAENLIRADIFCPQA